MWCTQSRAQMSQLVDATWSDTGCVAMHRRENVLWLKIAFIYMEHVHLAGVFQSHQSVAWLMMAVRPCGGLTAVALNVNRLLIVFLIHHDTVLFCSYDVYHGWRLRDSILAEAWARHSPLIDHKTQRIYPHLLRTDVHVCCTFTCLLEQHYKKDEGFYWCWVFLTKIKNGILGGKLSLTKKWLSLELLQ